MSAPQLLLLQKLRLRENHVFFALTIIIAVFAGLSAVLFTLAIKGTTYLLFGISPSNLRYLLLWSTDGSFSSRLRGISFKIPRFLQERLQWA